MRKLLGFDEVYGLIGKGRKRESFRVWLWRSARSGSFPAPVKTGANSVAWYADEVEAAIDGLPRVSYAAPRPEAA